MGNAPFDGKEHKCVSLREAKEVFSASESLDNNCEEDCQQSKPDELLEGLKVLEIANVIAGPSCGLNLAQYGAQVTKIDAPDSDYYHPYVRDMVLLIDQGKKSIVVDLKTDDGQEIFLKLVEQSDVLVHNMLNATADRLGISYEKLRRVNGELIVCKLSGYGGVGVSGWENRGSFDNLMQATTGLQTEFGTLESPQDHGGITCGDVPSGITAAFGILLAVYNKNNTGKGAKVSTSLARVMTYAQFPFLVVEEDEPAPKGPFGQFSYGIGLNKRIYQCSDGWIYLETDAKNMNVLYSIVGQPEEIEQSLRAETCAVWCERLDTLGIGAHQVQDLDDYWHSHERSLTADVEQVDERETTFVLETNVKHPCGKAITLLALSAMSG